MGVLIISKKKVLVAASTYVLVVIAVDNAAFAAASDIALTVLPFAPNIANGAL